jgi:hypothetical protein
MAEITEELARQIYGKYLEAGLKMFPPFKGCIVKLIQFRVEHFIKQ